MTIYQANSFNLGFVGDVHSNVTNVDKIFSLHPEISEWFFLGDLVSFINRGVNENSLTEDWYFKNKDRFVFWIKGNHEWEVANRYINISHNFSLELKSFKKHGRIYLPNEQKLELFHSKPNNFIDFVDPDYTEREFVDDYADFIDDETRSIIIGHNHKAFKKSFPSIETEIWSIGACLDGYYGVTSLKTGNFGVEHIDINFKKI